MAQSKFPRPIWYQDTWNFSIVTFKFIHSLHLTVKLDRESWRARYFSTSLIWAPKQSVQAINTLVFVGICRVAGERMASASTSMQTISLLLSKTSNGIDRRGCSKFSYYPHLRRHPSINKSSIGIARASSSFSDASVPDYLSSDW